MKKVEKLTIADIYNYVTPYAECVSSTYGPNGANVLIQTDGGQMITKDGVTVSNSLEYSCPVQSLVVNVLKQAARETVSKVGDGTTSTVVVAHSLLHGLSKLKNYNELKIKKVIDSFSERLEASIKKYGENYVVSAEDIRRVINISTNGDVQVADCIYEAVMHAGVGGNIVIKNSPSASTFLEYKEGYEMPSGYFGPSFVNNHPLDCTELENPLILVTDLIIEDAKAIQKLASFVDRAKRPIFIIADDVRGEALAFLHMD
jgi:chaperonin GroEL